VSQCVLNGKAFDQGQEPLGSASTCVPMTSSDVFGLLTTRIRGVGKGSVSSGPLAADEV
jgi:hypothetical protein